MHDVLILIHGCHLKTEGWESIMWGDPLNGVLGRIPKALEIVREYDNPLLSWGSGGSCDEDGLKEAEVSFKHALERYKEILQLSHMHPLEVKDYLESIAHMNLTQTTTTQEVVAASELCVADEIKRLILVSSPTHVARCHQEALKLKNEGLLPGVSISAEASDVSYTGYGPQDVVIVEPPHRGDMPQIEFHVPVRKIFQFLKEPKLAKRFNYALGEFVDGWAGELDRK